MSYGYAQFLSRPQIQRNIIHSLLFVDWSLDVSRPSATHQTSEKHKTAPLVVRFGNNSFSWYLVDSLSPDFRTMQPGGGRPSQSNALASRITFLFLRTDIFLGLNTYRSRHNGIFPLFRIDILSSLTPILRDCCTSRSINVSALTTGGIDKTSIAVRIVPYRTPSSSRTLPQGYRVLPVGFLLSVPWYAIQTKNMKRIVHHGLDSVKIGLDAINSHVDGNSVGPKLRVTKHFSGGSTRPISNFSRGRCPKVVGPPSSSAGIGEKRLQFSEITVHGVNYRII